MSRGALRHPQEWTGTRVGDLGQRPGEPTSLNFERLSARFARPEPPAGKSSRAESSSPPWSRDSQPSATQLQKPAQ
jgi:hypothetical protein